jgi:hypothetical protein
VDRPKPAYGYGFGSKGLTQTVDATSSGYSSFSSRRGTHRAAPATVGRRALALATTWLRTLPRVGTDASLRRVRK